MPVECSIKFPRLSESEMGTLDYDVMKHVFDTHNELGCLCDESVYQLRLASRLENAGFRINCEIPVTLEFRDFSKVLYLDLVVNRRSIYELKTVSKLTEAHTSQMTTYLFLTNAARGKIVNFRPTSVESIFVNSLLDDLERRRLEVVSHDWAGTAAMKDLITDLVRDWGTGLDASLYTQAITHCLGGEGNVIRQVPMKIDAVSLGNQRFHLADAESAFRITTFQKPNQQSFTEFRRMIAPSPLKAFHWINIARHEIGFSTVTL